MTKPRIAVVGGGIFGVTTAVKLAQRGYSVDLFERNRDILMGASGANQYRLHSGYHYPRSADTAMQSRDSAASFMAEYSQAIRWNDEHYYCIAKRDSLTSADQFLRFCRELSLPFVERWPSVVAPEAIELALSVEEHLFDVVLLRKECWRKLRAAGVNIMLCHVADSDTLRHHDFVVIATYSDLNSFAHTRRRFYQFELCEKPVVRLPDRFARHSVVIMDGPFMCLDPIADGNVFVLGNVVHAIHTSNVGIAPAVDPELRPFLDCGIVRDFPFTKYEQFIEAAAEFFPGIRNAEYLGSMLTIRAVLPGQDATDARPTIVERLGERMVSVFSGKIGTAVQAARVVVAIADEALQPKAAIVP